MKIFLNSNTYKLQIYIFIFTAVRVAYRRSDPASGGQESWPGAGKHGVVSEVIPV